MGFLSGVILEINSAATASNVNSGGFNPNNANMATDGAAASATGSSPLFSSASYTFVANDVGKKLYIKSGTNWVTNAWYTVAAVVAGVAQLDAATGNVDIFDVNTNRFTSNTVDGCATVSNPTGATWTMDYSQTTSTPWTATDLASTNGTTNPSALTSATITFGVNFVGNTIHVNSGASWTATWWEIVSVSGGAMTINGAAGSAATLSGGTFHIGGALSLGAASDVTVLALVPTISGTGSGRMFVKSGTYSPGATAAMGAGSSNVPNIIEGYVTKRGDRPTGSSMPVFAMGTNAYVAGNNNHAFSLMVTSTGSPAFGANANALIYNCKGVNTSTSAGRAGIGANGTPTAVRVVASEGVSLRGSALSTGTGTNWYVEGCYLHDSDTGVTAAPVCTILNNIIACNVTRGVTMTPTTGTNIIGNTFYGAENKLGVGFNYAGSGGGSMTFLNNILYGFTTAISSASATVQNIDDYNDYYNNTTDINNTANWQKGPHDYALDPGYSSNIQQLTHTGDSTAASTLTAGGGINFLASGVVAGRDYLQIISGTGSTAGQYSITAVGTNTLTTDIALGTATGVSWQITIGRDFSIGANLKALGYPGVFPGGYTTGYLDIGAVQTQESASGGPINYTYS